MLVDEIKFEVLEINKNFMLTDADNYDFWNNHIKYVVKESLFLADKLGADTEVVEIGAMLHDIAMMKRVGTKADHHINGAKIAEQILTKHKVDKVKQQKIIGCVLHHRASSNAENLEELCVADADILAHFSNIPMCFFSAFKLKGYNLNDMDKLKAWFEKDYNDLSDKTKIAFKNRYENIMKIIFGED